MSTPAREPVIVDVVRTDFGKRGGALAHWHPVDLLGFALRRWWSAPGSTPSAVDDVIGGCVTQAGEQSTNVTRNGWVAAGLPQTVPATTVDRQCGSSQQAVHFAAAGVVAGHYDLAVACGVESMSRVPLASNARGGTGPFPPSFLEQSTVGCWAQFRVAQVLADRWGVTREEMDAYSLESHRRAADGHGLRPLRQGGGAGARSRTRTAPSTGELLEADEGIRRTAPWSPWPGSRRRRAGSPRPRRTSPPGNSSQMTDGAAAMLIAERSVAERLGPPDPGPLRPLRGGGRGRRRSCCPRRCR